MPASGDHVTALHPVHEKLGAHFTDFAGWQMPLRYGSELAEHRAVRESAGIFDLSHMGEITVEGNDAAALLDHAFAGKLSRIAVGRAKYTLLLNTAGGVLDDVIVYRLGEQRYLVVANAANRKTVASELSTRGTGFEATVSDTSEVTALIAVQGPTSAGIVARALAEADAGITDADIAELRYYRALLGRYEGDELVLARTGYTGEDGFELLLPAAHATTLWELISRIGGEDLIPCGLACRDTLRLEAGMPLYGQELGPDLLPAQSGLGGVVALKSKDDFIGRSGIEGTDVTDRPVLVGLVGEGRRAARTGARVLTADGEEIGHVSSGALSPTLGHPVAMAFVPPRLREAGTSLQVDIRGKQFPVTVTDLPFYHRD